MKKELIVLFLFIVATDPLSAETIILKSGKTIEANIIEKKADCVQANIGGVPITYYLDDIDSIDGTQISPSAVQESIPVDTTAKEASYDSKTSRYQIRAISSVESEYGIRVNKAVDLMGKKDFAAAITELQVAIQKNPGESTAYLNIASCYHAMDQNQKALEYLEKAYQVNPTDPDIIGNLGVIYFALGQHQQAIDYLQKAIAMDPDGAQHYNNLGIAYYNLKKYKEAEKQFLKAKELSRGKNRSGEHVAESYLNQLKNIQ